MREIAALTGTPKTTVRETLTRAGLVLRSFKSGSNVSSQDPNAKRSGRAPYGFGYLEGSLVKDPKEYPVVQKIIHLWQSGKGQRAIAQILNDQKISTRHGKRWSHGVVGTVLKRHQNKKSIP